MKKMGPKCSMPYRCNVQCFLLLVVASVVLAVFMGMRFYKTGKFMPAGLVWSLR